MPAVSRAQQKLMAVAEHSPEKVKKENRGVLGMSQEELHKFASGKMKGKPEHIKKPPKHRKWSDLKS